MIQLLKAWMTIWILICNTRPSADANGVRRSNTLLGTIKTSWTNIAHKLDNIDHTTGSWKPGTHPFNPFKYIKITRRMAFAAATRNCGTLSGNLLYGDADLAKYIPELTNKNPVWYSTKDTRPIATMKNEDIQYFGDNIGTCYTVNQKSPTTIEAHEAACNQKHESVCIKMLENHQEAYTYDSDVQDMKQLAMKLTNEDTALIDTIQRLLQIGKPATDSNHPASLGQTIALLVSLDTGINTLATEIPLFPEKKTTIEKVSNNRNTAHTITLMILAQHLENYATKVDNLAQARQEHSSDAGDGNSGLTDEFTEAPQQIETTQSQTEKHPDYNSLTDTLQTRLETIADTVDNNQKKIKTTQNNLKTLNKRLDKWIQEEIGQKPNEEDQTTRRPDEEGEDNDEDNDEQDEANNDEIKTQTTNSSTNSTNSLKIPRVVLDILENEKYVWIATVITTLFTLIATANSILTCIYLRTAKERHKKLKRHLQMTPKYREEYRTEEDVDDSILLDKPRLDRVDTQLHTLHKAVKVLQEEMKAITTRLNALKNQVEAKRTGPSRKKNKSNAPNPPL